MNKSETYLEKLREAYEAYPEIAGSELAKIDSLADEMSRLKDPVWKAFKDNPITQRLFKQAVNTYRSCKMNLANDDGSLPSQERAKLHMSSLWALWYIKALGGDPELLRQNIEAEIERFAMGAGISA